MMRAPSASTGSIAPISFSPELSRLIFDRSSALTRRAFRPYREWIEAELLYDIAGQLNGDQDAVLRALSHDVRAPEDAAT
jgi:hypothetical protein